MRVLFHIGMHKTATTFIQEQVLPQVMAQNSGLLCIGPSHPFLQCWDETVVYPADISSIELNEEHRLIKAWRQYVEAVSPDTVIVSGEGLFSQMGGYGYQAHLRLLTQLFTYLDIAPELSVVLRDPMDYLRSLYMQVVTAEGYFISFADFIRRSETRPRQNLYTQRYGYFPDFSAKDLSYATMIHAYRDTFKEKLHVLFFEDFISSPRDFLAAFFSPVQIDVSTLCLDSKAVNPQRSGVMRRVGLILSRMVLVIARPTLGTPYAAFRRRYFDILVLRESGFKATLIRSLDVIIRSLCLIARLNPVWNWAGYSHLVAKIFPSKARVWNTIPEAEVKELSTHFQADSQALISYLDKASLPSSYLSQ